MGTNVKIINLFCICIICSYSCVTTNVSKYDPQFQNIYMPLDLEQFQNIYNQGKLPPLDLKKGPQYLIIGETEYMIEDFLPFMSFSKDTIEIQKREIKKTYRTQIHTYRYCDPEKKSKCVSFPYDHSIASTGAFEKFIKNKKTDLPLHGIYKINHGLQRYSIGCYFNGSPYLPWLAYDSIQGRIDYYKRNVLQGYSLFRIEEGSLTEQKISNKKHFLIYNYKFWDVNVVAKRIIYRPKKKEYILIYPNQRKLIKKLCKQWCPTNDCFNCNNYRTYKYYILTQ